MKIQINNYIVPFKNIANFQGKNQVQNILKNFGQADYLDYADNLSTVNKNTINFCAKKWVTENNKEQIIKLYKEGKTQTEIAKIFDCNYTTIGLALKKWGIDTKKPTQDRKIDEIKDLIKQGKTVKEISAQTNVSISALRKLLNRYNIEYGGFSEINKDKIIELYNEGLNYSQIAGIMNCTHATIRYAFKKWGIEYKAYNERIADRVIELYNSGKNTTEIAAIVGCTAPTVRKTLKSNNIGYQSPIERNKDKIIDLYNQGLNYSQIAKHIDCSHEAISTAFEKWGIQ